MTEASCSLILRETGKITRFTVSDEQGQRNYVDPTGAIQVSHGRSPDDPIHVALNGVRRAVAPGEASILMMQDETLDYKWRLEVLHSGMPEVF